MTVDLTVRRERIGTVDYSRNPAVLNLTFSPEQLWSSKMDNLSFVQNTILLPLYMIGGIPYDGKPTEITRTVDISLTVIFIVLSTVGIIFAIICLIFNFVFRERK